MLIVITLQHLYLPSVLLQLYKWNLKQNTKTVTLKLNALINTISLGMNWFEKDKNQHNTL